MPDAINEKNKEKLKFYTCILQKLSTAHLREYLIYYGAIPDFIKDLDKDQLVELIMNPIKNKNYFRSNWGSALRYKAKQAPNNNLGFNICDVIDMNSVMNNPKIYESAFQDMINKIHSMRGTMQELSPELKKLVTKETANRSEAVANYI